MSMVLPRSPLAQVGITLLAIGSACATSLALDERWVVLPFCFAIVIAACAGRWRTGVAATLLSAIAIKLLSHAADPLGIGVFLSIGCMMSLMIDRLGRDADFAKTGRDELRGSEEKLRLLVDSVHDYALYLLDSDGRVASWNSGAERLFGYGREGIIGKHVCCLYTDAAVEAGEPIQELELAQALGRCERRDWHLRRDGGRVRAHTVLTAIRDGGGELRGYAIVMRELIAAPSARSLTGLLDEHRRGIELALTNRT